MNDPSQELEAYRQRLTENIAQKDLQAALRNAEQGRELAATAMGKTSLHYATWAYYCALIYQMLGDNAMAEPLLKEAIALQEPSQYPMIYDTHATLGNVYLDLERYAEAADCFLEALASIPLAHQWGETVPQDQLADIYENLGKSLAEMGKYQEAYLAYDKASSAWVKLKGSSSMENARAVTRMAEMSWRRGAMKNAEILFERVKEMYGGIAGLDEYDPEYTSFHYKLARFYDDNDNELMADLEYTTTTDLYREIAGEQDPAYLRARAAMAGFYRRRQRFAEAENVYFELVVLYGINPTPQNYGASISCLLSLAAMYYEMHFLQDSRKWYQNVIDDLARTGPALAEYILPYHLWALSGLSVVSEAEGDPAAAASLRESELNKAQEAYGMGAQELLDPLIWLGGLYWKTGRPQEAAACLERALALIAIHGSQGEVKDFAALDTLAGLYERTGVFDLAAPLWEQAAAGYPEQLKPGSLLAARAQTSAGMRLLALGETAGAAGIFAGVLRALEKIRGPQTYFAGRLVSLLEQANPSPEFSRLALALARSALGCLKTELGQYDFAEDDFHQALELYRPDQADEAADTAICLSELGSLNRITGRLAEARALLEQSRDLLEKIAGSDDPRLAYPLGGLALLQRELGEYAQAEASNSRAYELLKEQPAVYGMTMHGTALTLQKATLQREAGKYSEAMENILAALNYGMENTLLGAHAQVEAARLYLELGSLELALQSIDKASTAFEEVYGPELAPYFDLYEALASVKHQAGDQQGAWGDARFALNMAIRALGRRSLAAAACIPSLAWPMIKKGYFSQAEELLSEAGQVITTLLGPQHPRAAEILWQRAAARFGRREKEEASRLYQQAAGIYQSCGLQTRAYANLLREYAAVQAYEGKPGEAAVHLETLTRLDDYLLEQVFAAGTGTIRMNSLEIAQADFARYLSAVFAAGPVDEPTVQAVVNVVLRRKAADLEFLAWRRALALKDDLASDNLGLWESNRRSAVRGKVNVPRMKSTDPIIAMFEERMSRDLLAHAQEIASSGEIGVDWSLSGRGDMIDIQLPTRDVTYEAVLQAIPAGAALVEFLQVVLAGRQAAAEDSEGEPPAAHYLAFLLEAGETPVATMLDLGKCESIDTLVLDYRKSFGAEKDTRAGGSRSLAGEKQTVDRELGLRLRRELLDPILRQVPRIMRLYISPDGSLTRLPFEVLPADDGGYLIDHYAFTYLSSARDILRFGQARETPPSNSLVVAAPDFDLRDVETTQPAAATGATTSGLRSQELAENRIYFAPLQGTLEEGQWVAQRLGADLWIHEQAMVRPLARRDSPCILHLATHGFFLKDQAALLGKLGGSRSEQGWESPMLRSGLAMAGANAFFERRDLPDTAEDGLLTAEDVSAMKLQGTELVVLSACDTGLGEVKAGEGVFGLRRGFVLAGARTLVMSLWKVPDEATRLLMQLFYSNLLEEKMGRAEALRQAQLTLRKEAKYQDPFFWGAFICQGDPSPLLETAG